MRPWYLAPLLALATPLSAQLRFSEDFESGLDGWRLVSPHAMSIENVGGPGRGRVLVMNADGWDVYALVRGSETWGNVRVDGEVLFPTDEHNYLGLLYNYREHDGRVDFGNIYIKGNGSYLRVNPHRDGNVGRTLYEEYRTPLTGAAAIEIGRWQQFRLEVVENVAHLYVGDLSVPQLVFPYYEATEGAVGFQPRSVGGPVWIDNIRIESITSFTYRGAARPAIDHRPDSVLTSWTVAGPFTQHDDQIARDPARAEWRLAPVDGRGAVLTAAVTDYAGPRTVAYFRTTVEAAAPGEAILHISSVDDPVIWINGRFRGFPARDDLAWHDFWSNPDHAGNRLRIALRRGTNDIVIRVRGGQYATGGFFARIEPPAPGR